MEKKNNSNDELRIFCNLKVGERLKNIQGENSHRTGYEYIVMEEYLYHYVIGIKHRTDLVPDRLNYIYTSVSKASIFCGNAVLIKENGERVRGLQLPARKKTVPDSHR